MKISEIKNESTKNKAVRNVLTNLVIHNQPEESKENILGLSLSQAFMWSNSPEGFDFWHAVLCGVKQ